MERKPQTLANHAKFDPLYHFFLAPVALLMVLGSVWAVYRNPGWHSLRYILFSIWLVALVLVVRTYPLKVQDRVIRLEERLRLAMLLPESLRARIPELTEAQLIGLRFASDAELPGLVERALKENLSGADIKKAIQVWRPDYWRV